MRFERGRCGPGREDRCHDSNKAKCPFSQRLCVKFAVDFNIDADIDDVDLSCGE